MKGFSFVPNKKGSCPSHLPTSYSVSGRSIYQPDPIVKAEREPPMDTRGGELKSISGSSVVPPIRDLSGLSNVLSSVSIGDRRKGRKKIRL